MENQDRIFSSIALPEEEKKEFSRQVLSHALTFMQKDNEVLGHFSVFTGALANHIKDNPKFFSQVSASRLSAATKEEISEITQRINWDDVQHIIDAITQIVNLIREDKRFFAALLAGIFGWDIKF